MNLYNQPLLGEDLRRLLVEACTLAINLKVTHLVIVGDLFDSNKPTPDLINFVLGAFAPVRAAGIKIVGIAGDHDKPINNEAWVKVCNVESFDACQMFKGRDFDDDPEVVKAHLLNNGVPDEKVEWLFAHAMAPALWPFCDERKKIDFNNLGLGAVYPNLRGVILGDIHQPLEGTFNLKANASAYIGYCGSLGVTCSSDLTGRKGVLYYDGAQLSRVDLPLGRDYEQITLTTTTSPDLAQEIITKYKGRAGRKPVFLIKYCQDTKARLVEFKELHNIGIVRTVQQRQDSEGNVVAVNIRSDLNNEEKITTVLRGLTSNDEVYSLAGQLLRSPEPKACLNEFKQTQLN